ncbi:MAG: bifunctional phosphoribosylaminoimidazolecarboxamide formyltransferase/IMP cyclohydrolase [Candidatus Thalassarchaeaceae archaeon]|jgi:phosphoribosylaminoimidazolecarboxamide formyltransferase/IMP cyclohydrolase|nr:bifunctional phosphoribosylaminoimidazolecarboxamide formyltransferase/IMP cyclohydrolase [Candidatus Thalassarchaeaceae archaeon]
MAPPRALISVWEKTGIEDLGTSLVEMGWELISTGGTAAVLREVGLEVTDVSEITNHPEVLDGRVKTLHPAVHAPILARSENQDDMATLSDLGYTRIDLVCINLYPFEATAAIDPPASDNDLLEMIDIGGPTIVRSSAKNHADVIVLTNSDQYSPVLELLSLADGAPSGVSLSERQSLALCAFQNTAAYDTAVSNELESRFSDRVTPSRLLSSSQKGSDLRYGENPHQPASFYPSTVPPYGLAAAEQHGGKPLSYNNYLDLDGALRLARSLLVTCPGEPHACVIVKHSNPCGAAVAATQVEAWENSLASDPESAFGCVIAFTMPVEKLTATAIGDHFLECVIAPGYETGALEILSSRKNRRMLTLDSIEPRAEEVRIRQLDGGWLSQVQGPPTIDWDEAECVTEKQVGISEITLARFGSAVLSEVKSNAIILVSRTGTGCATVGVGPGQTSRIEAVRIAARRAGEKAAGSMMLSDAFFPFRDGIDAAHEIGVEVIVQPGGSIRDQESIDAANEHGIAMIFTGTRQFLH